MSILIEEGKYYRRRCGDIDGPLKRIATTGDYQFQGPCDPCFVYTTTGTVFVGTDSQQDLVEEVPNPNAPMKPYYDDVTVVKESDPPEPPKKTGYVPEDLEKNRRAIAKLFETKTMY
jgi:hypothetical protein